MDINKNKFKCADSSNYLRDKKLYLTTYDYSNDTNATVVELSTFEDYSTARLLTGLKIETYNRLTEIQKVETGAFFEFFPEEQLRNFSPDLLVNYYHYVTIESAKMTDLRIKVPKFLVIESSSDEFKNEHSKPEFQEALFSDLKQEVCDF